MTIPLPTNWPNPERPGEPMFPEKTLRHALKKKDTGEIIIRSWKSNGQHWDMIGHSAQWCSETYFYEGPVLTPAQIAEMLAAERERCAKECERLKPSMDEIIGNSFFGVRGVALVDAAAAIRNLGAAP